MSQQENHEEMTLFPCFSNNNNKKILAQGPLCAGVPRTALGISSSLISQVPVSARQMVYDRQAIRKTAKSRKLGGVK